MPAAEACSEVAEAALAGGCAAHEQQRDDRTDEGHGVDRERISGAHGAHEDAADDRSDHRPDLEGAGDEADGVRQLVALDDLGDERLADGVVHRRHHPEHEREDEHVPDRHVPGQGEPRQGRRGHGHRDLGGEQDAALGEAVGEQSAVQPEDQGRQELARGHGADGHRAVGHGEDQPVLGDSLDPATRAREQQTAQQEAEVAVGQCGEVARNGPRSKGVR